MHYFVSFLVKRKGKLVVLLLLPCRCIVTICSVALPHGAVGWNAVCDCGTS